ncbi:YraN family protein [Clostridium sp. OS1-26]|uniref:YraN family protein n=1 Tax=Clostridium sp. OS1-26 TaxID=3070681 RepID=UPI0027E09ACB|nr:YraN family protein [Clostridium sp. OS1-26]WML35106.1 YraN family protein [Clostridium sp. OS1-26]
MHSFNKDIGSLGEEIAETYLRQIGYTVLDRNFRCKIGEIDIIGKDGDYICFIEVKTRYGSIYGSPCEAVNYSKQRRIYRTAEAYIMKKKLFKFNFRFDVIEIILNNSNNTPSIRLIKDAFQI